MTLLHKVLIRECPFPLNDPDLISVNAARTSFSRHTTELRDVDEALLSRLIEHDHINVFFHAWKALKLKEAPSFADEYEAAGFHWSPEDSILTCSLKALPQVFSGKAVAGLGKKIHPHQVNILKLIKEVVTLPVDHRCYRHHYFLTLPFWMARQWQTHRIGFSRSEISRRYYDDLVTFFEVDTWRAYPKKKKQGHAGPLSTDIQTGVSKYFNSVMRADLEVYRELLNDGVCPEQARMALPMNTMTTIMETASNEALARALDLRLDVHAQEEIRVDLAEQLLKFLPVDPRTTCNWKERLR